MIDAIGASRGKLNFEGIVADTADTYRADIIGNALFRGKTLTCHLIDTSSTGTPPLQISQCIGHRLTIAPFDTEVMIVMLPNIFYKKGFLGH